MEHKISSPSFPESIEEGTIAKWYIEPGQECKRNSQLVDIETEKIVLEVVAPADGVLEKILKKEGDTVTSSEVIGHFVEKEIANVIREEQPKEANKPSKNEESQTPQTKAGPAARKAMAEHGVNAEDVKPSGDKGQITKLDVEQIISQSGNKIEKRVPMTRLRASIAKRLVEAQQNAAMLTTFNEVNMQPVMQLRNQYKDLFEKTNNGVRLGFMSFFVRAATEALKRFPAVNASLDGNDIVYHGYQDIGVAVSSDRGLIVPIMRNTDAMSVAEIEATIASFGAAAKENKITLDQMQGGTFTISNGGVFGSLLSTPILNPPQTAILGMHAIKERPMAVDGQVVILPMMYLALSYDHRLIDGSEAVRFLKCIKELIEDPARILLEL